MAAPCPAGAPAVVERMWTTLQHQKMYLLNGTGEERRVGPDGKPALAKVQPISAGQCRRYTA